MQLLNAYGDQSLGDAVSEMNNAGYPTNRYLTAFIPSDEFLATYGTNFVRQATSNGEILKRVR